MTKFGTKSGFLSAALLVCLTTSAFALEVKKTLTVPASPEATWKAIGDFCGIATWHPAITGCTVATKGSVPYRTLTLDGGGTVIEKLLGRSESAREYSYAITESPLPVDHYKSTIAVKQAGTGSTIVWSGSFIAKGAPDDKAVEVISGIYDSGLASLHKKLAP